MKIKRVLSVILVAVMVLGLLPIHALAATIEGLGEGSYLVPNHMTVTQDKVSTLAPGVIQHEVALFDKNGDRVEMLVAIADMAVETVNIYANYKDNQNQVLGMQKTTEQVAAAMAKHKGENYNPVVAINASYYNTGNGRPTGAFVMEGVDATAAGQGMAYPFFAILKDGTAMIGAKGEYDTYKDQIQEAVGGYIHLVKDGAICSGLNANDKYPRQTIGITADNKVILMTSDGNQAPVSIGMTVQEQAEVMLAMGCVEALHLDGGGSATYCAKPEGSDKLVVLNSPSNGSERAVSNTLMIVSSAVPDGAFHHASLTVENEYVTPGTTVAIQAVGVDVAGGAADIPETAVWCLADTSFGTISNGKFVSNGKTGDVEVQLVDNGEVVGDVTIHVVVPTALHFSKTDNIVPYDKTITLDISATYGVFDVALKESDLSITLDTAGAGTVDGITFTSPSVNSGITFTTITATFVGTELSVTANMTFGRGSEVLFDFEEGTDGANTDNWVLRTHESDPKNNEQGSVFIVDKETGLVHSGDQALAFNIDFSQTTGSGSSSTGYLAMSIGWNGDAINIKGAQRLGFWMYIPDDAMTTEITMNLWYYDAKGVLQRRTVDGTDDNGTAIYTPYWKDNMEKSGWHYVSVDLSKFKDDLFIHDEPGYTGGAYKRNFFIKLYCAFGSDTIDFSSFHGNFTYYIDDITVDYSSAADDRELPVFSSGTAYGEMEGTSAALVYGQTATVAFNKMQFAASVTDNMTKNNYTGLNPASAKIYVDGVAVSTAYSNGTMSSDYVTLADGLHTVTYEIADNAGNVKTIVRKINVQAESELPTVVFKAKDPSLDRLLSGSVYWTDLVATDLSRVQSVKVLLNLNSSNAWELEHMKVAKGFTATYSATDAMAAEFNVLVKFVRNGEPLEDTNVLASLPVRVWYSRIHENKNHTDKTPAYMWTTGAIDSRDVRVSVDMGKIIYTDNTESSFSGFVRALHEGYTHYYNMDKEYHAAKGTFHVHTETALIDKPATCTEDGYTGRTYCEVCDSVAVWGTTLEATGHTYEMIEGVLKCACGELFNGVHTDGKTYVDGLVIADGWAEDIYFVDGVALTGVQKIDGYYYDFGETGVCADQMKFTGLFYNTELGAYSFSKMGVISTGWINIEDSWYFFHGNGKAATGHYENYFFTYGVTYDFEETGKLVTGVWHDHYINGKLVGTMYFYGPNCYKDGWQEIDGNRYYFDGIYRAEGPHMIMESLHRIYKCFVFDENGVYTDEEYTGFVKTNDFLCYVEKNIAKTEGVFKLGNDLYYAHHDGKLATATDYVTRANGYLEEYTYYPFESNGRLYNGIYEENGGLYYYVNGVKQGCGVYYNEAGDYYVYVRSSGTCATGWYEVKANDVLPTGMRLFGDDGKMFTGVVEENGDLYFYRHGVKQGRGVHYVADGDYYVYVRSTGTCAVGYYEVKESAANGLLNPQFYMFGDDGKLLDLTGVMSVAGKQYYFINGAKQGRGMYYNAEGDYYVYVKTDETVATGRYYVNATNGLLPKDYYLFGEDGRTLTGLVEDNGAYYYYVNGVQMGRGVYYNAEGDYYVYVRSTGTCATGLYEVKANDLIEPGKRLFTSDGKTFTGVREENGNLYYYLHGMKMGRGMYYNVEGDYYVYVKSNGTLATGSYYVNATNDLLPKATYHFGTDGKLMF